MKSNYPVKITHPFLYNIFRLKCCAVYLLFLYGLAAVLHTKTIDPLCLVCAVALPFAKFEVSWFVSYGHGVFTNQKVLGFPRNTFYQIILLLLVCVASLQLSNKIQYHIYSEAIMVSLLLAALRWKFTMYDNTLRASQYELKRHMRNAKRPEEEVQKACDYYQGRSLLVGVDEDQTHC